MKKDNEIFLNKLPKIIPRLSLSNFHKRNNNNYNEHPKESNKFTIFNKTSGIIGFKGITFNRGISGFRNTNYKINNFNSNNFKFINLLNHTIKYKIVKEQLLSQNANNNLQFINNMKIDKDNKNIKINKNSFNIKTVINNNKSNNQKNININMFKNNNKKILAERNEKKIDSKRKENNLCEENNDSFIDELNDLFSNVKGNGESKQNLQDQTDENDNNNDSDNDKEPDPRINFEQISRVNKSRPQTSYGGLNTRRKNLQTAFKNLNNRPATSNIPE